jgi:hypothetical protein
MPSTLRSLATLAGCAAVTAATLAVGAAPVAAASSGLSYSRTHARAGATVTITDTSGPYNATSATVSFAHAAGVPVTMAMTASSIDVKVPSDAKSGPVTVTPAGQTAITGPKFTVDPTPAHTHLALTLSKQTVTYPGKVSVQGVATSGGHPVKGLMVQLQHRVRGTTAWHHMSGTTPQRTTSKGVVSWTVEPKSRGAFRAFTTATPHFAMAISPASKVGVRPAVHLSIPATTDVLLPVTATGRVSPKISGRLLLERRLNHHWQVVRHPRVRHGRFRTTVRTSVPGSQKFRVVRPKDSRHLGAASPAVATQVTAPTLRIGSSGPVVVALQRRLHKLHYDIGSRDGSYGWDAEHAVTAFEKVQGMGKDGVAGPGVFKALADPKKPHLHHVIKNGTAVEVNIEKQVLLISKHGKLWRILDTSTAGGYLFTGSNGQTERAVTPRGHFHVVYKINALVHARLGTLNRPSFFNYDGYAIHGEGNGNDGGEVPPFPNSHGCVRITDNAVNRYYSLLAVGTSVWIY